MGARQQLLVVWNHARYRDAEIRMKLSFEKGGPGFDGWALTQHLGGELWQLREPLRYRARSGVVYTIPSGLRFDGASIPRVVWSLLPSKASCLEFGAFHDWLYRVGPSLGLNRRMADDLGWEALVMQDIGDEWQRDAIWDGVRIGGGDAWRYWRALGLTADDPVALITEGPG